MVDELEATIADLFQMCSACSNIGCHFFEHDCLLLICGTRKPIISEGNPNRAQSNVFRYYVYRSIRSLAFVLCASRSAVSFYSVSAGAELACHGAQDAGAGDAIASDPFASVAHVLR